METTTRDEFEQMAAEYPVVPVTRTIAADLETPVSAYLKVARSEAAAAGAWSFLLESVEGGTRWGRYSLLGCSPSVIVEVRGRETSVRRVGQETGAVELSQDPLAAIRAVLRSHRMPLLPDLPRLTGGLVGYLGYGTAGLFERVPAAPSGAEGVAPPDALLFAPRTVVAFDNLTMTITLVALTESREGAEAYERALVEIDRLEALLAAPLPTRGRRLRAVRSPRDHRYRGTLRPHVERRRFEVMVAEAREAIHAGEAIQVVLSHAFSAETDVDPLDTYRALRRLNPSPCLFHLELGDVVLCGASPELMVRVEDGRATLRPIAGTRPRGTDSERDALLEAELLSDAKERAEHVMLVDLARNDLGRVACPGGVTVEESFVVERYSHVMHLVSTVSAALRDDVDLVEVLAATFPAGTVSGAPKVRAMELIAALEPEARGPYAGAVGYLGFGGTMDTCIAIRTLVFHRGRVRVQAGAGVVADSDPASEYLETLHKCGVLFAALEAAGGPVAPPTYPPGPTPDAVPAAVTPGGTAAAPGVAAALSPNGSEVPTCSC